MTKKLKKAFGGSTLARTSSARTTRTATVSSSSPPLQSFTSRQTNLIVPFAQPSVEPSVKEAFFRLLKEDTDLREAVVGEILQSTELQGILREERAKIHREFEDKLQELRATILSDALKSCRDMITKGPNRAQEDPVSALTKDNDRPAYDDAQVLPKEGQEGPQLPDIHSLPYRPNNGSEGEERSNTTGHVAEPPSPTPQMGGSPRACE